MVHNHSDGSAGEALGSVINKHRAYLAVYEAGAHIFHAVQLLVKQLPPVVCCCCVVCYYLVVPIFAFFFYIVLNSLSLLTM